MTGLEDELDFEDAITVTRADAEREYTREELLEVLRELAASTEGAPRVQDLRESDEAPSPQTYTRRWESWPAALEAAGIETDDVQHRYTTAELLDILEQVDERREGVPTQTVFADDPELPCVTTYYNRFGSWKAALAEIGIEHVANDYTDEELLTELAEFAAEIGRPPKRSEVDDADSLPSGVTYTRRFGRWDRALEAAGLEPASRGYTEAELLEVIRDIAAETGRKPKLSDLDELDGGPSKRTFYNRFESWSAAVEQADI